MSALWSRAVIGASRRPQSIGHEILSNLVNHGFTGAVYPVNPSADVVRSMRCYKKLDDIEGPVDLAVIVGTRKTKRGKTARKPGRRTK